MQPLAPDRPIRVLIAEDNIPGAELIEAYLAETDWDTKIVGDGEAVLAAVRDWPPDVLLLDVMMPRLSGFEVCKRLRADPTTSLLPILMITALDQPSDVERAVEVGTNDFLTKPIHKTDLINRVRALLAARGAGSALEQTLAYLAAVGRAGS